MSELLSLHFIRPWWFLALIPWLAFAWCLLRQHRLANNWQAICDEHLLAHLLVRESTRSVSRLPLYLFLLALLCAIIALAGPAWSKRELPVYEPSAGTVFVLDLSPSMLADDVKPSRLQRAKFKLLDMLQQTNKTVVGLVVFAGAAYVVSPLTQDANTIASMVSVLNPDIMPTSGDRIAPALEQARQLLQQGDVKPANIVLITDSQAQSASLSIAKQLAEQGIHLWVLGIGSNAPVPLRLPSGGLRYDQQGKVMVSHFNAASLQKLAQAGNGHYVNFSLNNQDTQSIVAALKSDSDLQVQKKMAETEQWQDEGHWLLILITLLALLVARRGWWQELVRR